MALSPKDRERIIEEETLRFETRQNLIKKECAERPVRWPWYLAGALLVYLLYSWIFCVGPFCALGGYGMGARCGHHGAMMGRGHRCPVPQQEWMPGEKGAPEKK